MVRKDIISLKSVTKNIMNMVKIGIRMTLKLIYASKEALHKGKKSNERYASFDYCDIFLLYSWRDRILD